jgi:hypothetical protein
MKLCASENVSLVNFFKLAINGKVGTILSSNSYSAHLLSVSSTSPTLLRVCNA